MLKTLALATATCAMLTTSLSHAADMTQPLKVGLWGDQFYSDKPEEKAARTQQTIDSMNAHQLDFTLYAGDTKNGHTECTDNAIGTDVLNTFNRLNMPTLYSLGDNEWTDCHRTSNGGYDPLERLAFVRKAFFSQDKSQGKKPITVQRQGEMGGAYSENSRFVMNNVEFVALSVTGSNNNLVATEKQCTKKSKRTQADCDAASAEYKARNKMNIEWLKAAFKDAKAKGNAGIAIVIQADPIFPVELSDGGYAETFLPQLDEKNGFSDFYKTLIDETQHYDGQVVLIHGDSHYFRIDKPMYNANGQLTANFTRVEVFGEEDNSWIEMRVDPNSANVFSFQPVMLN